MPLFNDMLASMGKTFELKKEELGGGPNSEFIVVEGNMEGTTDVYVSVVNIKKEEETKEGDVEHMGRFCSPQLLDENGINRILGASEGNIRRYFLELHVLVQYAKSVKEKMPTISRMIIATIVKHVSNKVGIQDFNFTTSNAKDSKANVTVIQNPVRNYFTKLMLSDAFFETRNSEIFGDTMITIFGPGSSMAKLVEATKQGRIAFHKANGADETVFTPVLESWKNYIMADPSLVEKVENGERAELQELTKLFKERYPKFAETACVAHRIRMHAPSYTAIEQ